MADRDKYGNYVNDKGVTIKINTDKNGNDHISFYGGEVDQPHDAAHVNVNYDKESWSSTTHGPDKSDTSSGSGGCYLTTACMKHFMNNFNDKCYELQLLRWFRDNFVSEEDIAHYYEIAPLIVSEINSLPNSNEIYDKIYYHVIDVCVKAIEKSEYAVAYQRYKESILQLEEAYVRPALEQRLIRALQPHNA